MATTSVAFLSTGQIVTEEMALLGALAKFGMGMVHGDGNTRQCMATAVVAYKQSFGFDAPPYTYADFEESDVLSSSARTCASRTRSCGNACCAIRITRKSSSSTRGRPKRRCRPREHFAIRPKSDLEFFYGLAHILIAAGLDRPRLHRRPIRMASKNSRRSSPTSRPSASPRRRASASNACIELARTIHEGQRVSFWWTMGVNQSHEGVRTAQSLINLALMTGNIGRPGTGANSITGQCNAMGSRLFSNTTNLLGGRDFENAARPRRSRPASCGIDASRIPDRNSWAYPRNLSGILKGKIKGLWVIATNPAHSWINQNQLADILDRLDFLVVQDMYHTTETAQLADLVLPAAAWGEKEGTFINSERRFGLVEKGRPAPGQALADFSIFKLIADAWGVRRDVPRMGLARGGVSDPEAAVAEAGPATSPASPITRCSTNAAAFNGRYPAGRIVRRTAAAAVRRRPLLSRRRPGEVPVRTSAPMPEPPTPGVSASAAHRTRHGRAVAHADPHEEIGRAAQALAAERLRRNQSGRCRAN